jgi:osmoprotectant transport system permease protein
MISIIISGMITIFVLPFENLSNIVVRIFSGIYAIPSLALFALLIPILGIGNINAIFVLVLYNQFLLLRNFIVGLKNIPYDVINAGIGLGYNDKQLFINIKLPLAMPMILSGIQLSFVSSIGIATIASVIGAHGLGDILFDGLRTHNNYKLMTGIILSATLAISVNALFNFLKRKTFY